MSILIEQPVTTRIVLFELATDAHAPLHIHKYMYKCTHAHTQEYTGNFSTSPGLSLCMCS